MTRRYVLETGPRDNPTIIRWGFSRFGDGTDEEMVAAVDAGHNFGVDRFCVSFSSDDDPLKNYKPERMAAARLSELKRRCEKKHSLFAEQILRDELARQPEYYSVDGCRRDLEQRRADISALHRGTKCQYTEANQVKLSSARSAPSAVKTP